MFKYSLVITIIFSFFFISCNNDNFETVLSSGNLNFSKDTVFLDTVFTNISSSTRTLKVYNKSNEHITIPSIKLGRGENSFYRLNVDGIAGKNFENIDILAKDSIFVFIEATINHNMVVDPIYTDSIVFDAGVLQQDVKLVTLVQDAHFLFPQRDAQGVKEKIVLGIDAEGEEITVDGFYLDGNTKWEDDKPYVIYGYVGVPENTTLNIEKGTKIHFHQNSGLLVDKNASLKVNGILGDEVIFEGDRLEPEYSDIAGQWGTIWLRAGSRNHEIKNAIIKNNTLGILMDSIGSLTQPTLKIYNTQIYNTAMFGVLGRTANIKGENLVIGNNGMSSLACTIGGTYNFTHITLANYWSSNVRDFPALLVNNFIKFTHTDGSESVLARDLNAANFTNIIIDGNQNIEMIVEKDDGADFNYNFKNNLIKFIDENNNYSDNPLFDFESVNHYQNNILNGIPDFKSIETNNFIIGEKSDAIDNADKNTALQVPLDILGVGRITNPDIGAYQHIIFEE
ncbi:MAG: hypothetical protein ABFR32_04610 [Bacteroidota bacterium]